MHREAGALKRVVTVLAALALVLPAARPAVAQAAAKADRILEGRIMGEDGKAIQKAVVKVRNLDTGEEFSSAPTGANGSYKFSKLPPGLYEVAVQTERGMYLGNRTVDLANKQAQSYSFALKNVPPEQALEEAAAARGEERRPVGARPPVTPIEAAAKTSVWSNPLTATLLGVAIAVGAGIVIDEALDDDEDDGSPSAP